MSNLYHTLAEVYDAIYQSFINYDEEYAYYSGKLKKYNSKSVVEPGCGTGNLASRFISGGFKYTGLELNKAMLAIARRKNPGIEFIEADMRDFQLTEKKDACIIAGRSASYLFTNNDVMDAFHSIYKNLNSKGILCFDCIDAVKFIPMIKDGKHIIHNAEFNGRKFQRESFWSVNGDQNWAFNWNSVYSEIDEKGALQKMGEDNSTIRAFTKEDICLFLELCDFKIIEMEDRPSYAFDAFVTVAQKNS